MKAILQSGFLALAVMAFAVPANAGPYVRQVPKSGSRETPVPLPLCANTGSRDAGGGAVHSIISGSSDVVRRAYITVRVRGVLRPRLDPTVAAVVNRVRTASACGDNMRKVL